MAGIMIAAPKSGSGKTMMVCGLLALLKRKGWNPSAFKCGPDYIDGLFHSWILGVDSGNLDSFFEEPSHMRRKFIRSEAEHFVVVEGVMGYFDGLGGISVRASSYETAHILNLPVLLVVDGRGASLSLAATVKGFLDYVPKSCSVKGQDERNHIEGIIFNRVSPVIYRRLKTLVEEEFHIPVAGYVPELPFLQMESRHLGLALPDDGKELRGLMENLADCLEESLDLELLAEIGGRRRGKGDEDRKLSENGGAWSPDSKLSDSIVQVRSGKSEVQTRSGSSRGNFRLGVAMDEAFCFYYKDNLELLEDAGAELAYFSPVRDREIPSGVSGLLLGGGYPELYADRLSENSRMRNLVQEAARDGMPMLGECGGYLYLLDSLEGGDGREYPMAGVLTGRGYKVGRTGRFGYIELTAREELPYIARGETVRGHEFHYWDCRFDGERYKMDARKPLGDRRWPCMRVKGGVMAGFPHLYYPSCPGLVRRFADKCMAFGKE